jgi:phage terminase large subunit-like protein
MREGWINGTEGDAVDYATIERDILADSKLYKIEEIAADPWNATSVLQHLGGENLLVFEHRQGFASMSGPTKEFEKAVLAGRIVHGGNPMLRWMASNVTVETDASANLKPSKKKSTEKIDGIVAAIMAVGRAAMGEPEQPSYYETHELEIW